MKELFCSYEQSLALKELGFDKECLSYYNKKELLSFLQIGNEPLKGHYIKISNRLCSPMITQAFKFFREKYSIEGYVVCIRFNSKRLKGYQYVTITSNYQCFEQLGNYNTYEEAEQQCLNKLIEIVKND